MLAGHVGPVGRLRRDATHGVAQRRGISAFGRDAAQLQQRGNIVGASVEDLLDQVLKLRFAVGSALSLNFESQLIESADVLRVTMQGFAKIRDGRGRISARAFQGSEIGLDLSVVGGKRVGPVESLLRLVEVTLAKGQNAPVGPGGGFAGRLLGRRRKGAFRAHIVANFHRRQTYVKRLHELRVLGGLRTR